tara:strand:+ start:532 stop:1068 length:537 start_codon:yes stop_codon:yes gene_type:complete
MEETTQSGSNQPKIETQNKTDKSDAPEVSQKSVDKGKLIQSSTISISRANNPDKPIKPPKPEDKPFLEFIQNDLIPTLYNSLIEKGVEPLELIVENGDMPVVRTNCWQVKCTFKDTRKFWLCFQSDKISSLKTFVLAETGSEPSLLESFLIDEKKTTLSLLVSRILQRLNGQKWLGPN